MSATGNKIDLFAAPRVDLFAPRHAARSVKNLCISANLSYRRKSARHKTLDALRVANAAKDLSELPRADETLHVITRGNWAAWNLVRAILRLSAPAIIDELFVSTLSYNQANTIDLLALLDSGQVRRVAFLCSVYFQKLNAATFNYLAAQLSARGQRIVAARNHSKIIAAALTDGRHIVVESSANLRSCRNIEQFAITNDAGLFTFHKNWMERVFRNEEAKQ